MPRNGSGAYSLPAGNPVVSGSTISSTTHNNTMSDVATALTASIAKDGQTTPTADLPMGSFKHTSVANATARNQYATVDQVQDSDYLSVGSVGGTGNAITGSLTPAITAYVARMMVIITPTSANTGATTLALNGLTALDVLTPDGKACVGGELAVGIPAVLILDSGADDWIIQAPANSKLIPFTQKTDNYTLTNADCGSILYFNCAAGKSLTLPGAGIDIGFWCKVRVNGANSIGVASSGTLTWFSGAAATPGSPRTLASDGSTGGATVFITNSAAGVWEIEGAGIS